MTDYTTEWLAGYSDQPLLYVDLPLPLWSQAHDLWSVFPDHLEAAAFRRVAQRLPFTQVDAGVSERHDFPNRMIGMR